MDVDYLNIDFTNFFFLVEISPLFFFVSYLLLSEIWCQDYGSMSSVVVVDHINAFIFIYFWWFHHLFCLCMGTIWTLLHNQALLWDTGGHDNRQEYPWVRVSSCTMWTWAITKRLVIDRIITTKRDTSMNLTTFSLVVVWLFEFRSHRWMQGDFIHLIPLKLQYYDLNKKVKINQSIIISANHFNMYLILIFFFLLRNGHWILCSSRETTWFFSFDWA